MIWTVAKTLFIGLLAIMIAWGFWLRSPGNSGALEKEMGGLSSSLSDQGTIDGARKWGRAGFDLPERVLAGFPVGDALHRLKEGAGVAGIHLAIVFSTAPVFALGLAAATCLGLWGRERVRHGLTYSSPSWAYVGKQVAMGAVLGLSVFALSPVGLSYVTVWGMALGTCLGTSLYISNLPVKL